MPDRMRQMSVPWARAWFMLLVAAGCLFLAACSSGRSIFRSGGNSDSGAREPVAGVLDTGPGTVDTGGLSVYLETMQQMISGDSLTRSAAFNEAREAAEFAPTKINRLRYALALSIPDHSGSDPDQAATRLRALLAAGTTLTPAERRLATVQLQHANHLMILERNSAELNRRLNAALSEQAEQTANEAEIRALEAEIAILRAGLEDANQMLDAITSIEQSISEREDNDD